MALKSRKTRILGALVFAGVLIAVAYISSSSTFSIPSLFAPATANAESTQALLQAYAQKVGPDGKPLWEDELIQESSSTPLTNATTSEDAITESLPGTAPTAGSMTDQFAQNLFSQYIEQEGGQNPSDTDIDTFAENAIQQTVQNNTHTNAFSIDQVHVEGSGSDALLAYSKSADKLIAAQNVPGTKNEIDYFSDALEKNDPSALTEVAKIGSAYTALSSEFIQMSVPVEAQNAHLEIANAMANLGEDITDMSTEGTDPLRAYIGLQQYNVDSQALTKGFADIYSAYAADNLFIPGGTPGSVFFATVLVGKGQVLQDMASTTPN